MNKLSKTMSYGILRCKGCGKLLSMFHIDPGWNGEGKPIQSIEFYKYDDVVKLTILCDNCAMELISEEGLSEDIE